MSLLTFSSILIRSMRELHLEDVQHETPNSNSSERSLFAKTLLFPIAFASAFDSSMRLSAISPPPKKSKKPKKSTKKSSDMGGEEPVSTPPRQQIEHPEHVASKQILHGLSTSKCGTENEFAKLLPRDLHQPKGATTPRPSPPTVAVNTALPGCVSEVKEVKENPIWCHKHGRSENRELLSSRCG